MIDESSDFSHQEHLNRLEAQVQSLREQLRHAQRLAAIGTMTAMVAHEFNNILTPIVSYAQMAKSDPKLADKAIANAAAGGQRATQICNAILDLTHDGQKRTRVNLAGLVRQTLSAMAREPQRDGIDLSLDCPADLAITTRPVELEQVLLNLLINARTTVLAKGGHKQIKISCRRRGGNIYISVCDTGAGIAPENLDKIFQPFFTTRSASNDGGGGHGLGLSICHDIITGMGGTISVQSKLGQGSTFSVRIPQ